MQSVAPDYEIVTPHITHQAQVLHRAIPHFAFCFSEIWLQAKKSANQAER